MENLLENENLILVLETLLYVISAFVLFFVGKLAFELSHRKIDAKAELVKKDNLAFALSNVGYYIGLLISIGSVIIGPSYGIWIDLVDILVFGALSILLLNLSSVINDQFILRSFSIRKELIEDQNAGTGAVHAAGFIASGLVVFGAMSGEGTNFFPNLAGGYLLSGLITAALFWIVGMAVLILVALIYRRMLPYDVHDHIEKDNVAVGISFAGALVAIAILVGHGTSGDFEGWTDHFLKVLIEVVIGLILLPVVRWVTDKILLPGERITDEIVNQEHPNIGASLIEAFAYIGGAVLITWCV